MLESFQIPDKHYVRSIDIRGNHFKVEFKPKKKVALLLVALGQNYWHYAARVIQDCKDKFLPDHDVEIFLWTDYSAKEKLRLRAEIEIQGATLEEKLSSLVSPLGLRLRNLAHSYPEVADATSKKLNAEGLQIKGLGQHFELGSAAFKESHPEYLKKLHLELFDAEMDVIKAAFKGLHIIDTDMAPPPMPTLMRYHLFLQEEEALSKFDYLFYLDADMRVVDLISEEEICGPKLTCAKHPMYALMPKYIPPYESDPQSAAYIPRLGEIKQNEQGTWFEPLYAAGGFQGGDATLFIKAMKEMKEGITSDLNKNYIARWNDESHWNRYLWFHPDELSIVLDPGYIYPDSLIKEYYEPLWGRSYKPKIMTLTKPASLMQLGANDMKTIAANYIHQCPTCGDKFTQPNIVRVISCGGSGNKHEVEQRT